MIEWHAADFPAEYVRLEIRQRGSSAQTVIADTIPNRGFCQYVKVPWGMEIGSGYYVRLSTLDGRLAMESPEFRITR